MSPKENARPDGGRARAKGKPRGSRKLDTCGAETAQGGGLYSFREGNRLAARIVISGQKALLFVARDDGLRQVGGILDVGGADGPA